jgi:hypothetical protein
MLAWQYKDARDPLFFNLAIFVAQVIAAPKMKLIKVSRLFRAGT